MKKPNQKELALNFFSDFHLKSQDAYLRNEITLREKNQMNKIAYSVYKEL